MGAGVTSDGYHIVAPDPTGDQAGHAISRAIQLAGSARRTSTRQRARDRTSVGDVAEGKAITTPSAPQAGGLRAEVGTRPLRRSVGAVESILTVMALRDGVVPPTLNLRNLDPEIDLDVVAGEPRQGNYEYAINNSFGFAGTT